MAETDDGIDSNPTADIWEQEESVCMVLVGSTIVEYEGSLVPGVSFSPLVAINVARTLLDVASKILENKEKTDGPDD